MVHPDQWCIIHTETLYSSGNIKNYKEWIHLKKKKKEYRDIVLVSVHVLAQVPQIRHEHLEVYLINVRNIVM